MNRVKKNLSTEETRRFWTAAEKNAREVATWPAWKKGGTKIAVPETSRAHVSKGAEEGVTARKLKPCCSAKVPHTRCSCAAAASLERLVSRGQPAIDAFNAARPGGGDVRASHDGDRVRAVAAGAALLAVRVDESLKAMEHAPPMFGGPEAFEFTALTLIGIRQALRRPNALAANGGEVENAYERFVETVIGEPTNTYLHVILREHGELDKLPGLLGDFGRWVTREYPAEAAR